MKDVVDRLLNQAAQTPDAIAVAGPRPTTYAAFVERVGQFAAGMDDIETPRVLVAIEKGLDAYAAMFATLMVGGTYAPVNLSSPSARIVEVTTLFGPDIVVAHAPLASTLTETSSGRIVDPSRLARGGTRRSLASDAPAYVIFTSGSTGAPKGVAIPRSALSHYVEWLGPAMGIRPGDRITQHPNIGFDLSVLDIYGGLCFGASLHPFVSPSDRLFPARKVKAEALTIWNSVPSVISLMDKAGELDGDHLASVRLFTFCGEVLRQDQVAKLFAVCPDAVVLNTYGPTEATVAMTCRRLTAENHTRLCTPSAPLGTAIGDMRLDLAGGGDEGEIVITGPQLAAGYWEDKVLTDAKFGDFACPDGPRRAFYTGDYAARVNGELYFLGRSDDMVKVRGHRIHLSEICGVLQKLGWAEAVVFEAAGRLEAVVARTPGLVFDERRILGELSDRLDSYFVPAIVHLVDKFPRTANDKVDMSALKARFVA